MAILIWSRRALAGIAVAAVLLGPRPSATVAAQSVAEPALKAAFLLNFAKFTEWRPALAPSAALTVCSSDPDVSLALEASAGRAIDQHPVVVTRVRPDAIPSGCAVVYVGAIDARRVPPLAAQCRVEGALLVGDAEAFAEAGGAIGLFLEDGKMRFAINVGAVERARLRLSAKLLSLAKIIKD